MAIRVTTHAIVPCAAVFLTAAIAPEVSPDALVVMLRPPPRGVPAPVWRSTFDVRVRATGLRVRDTLAASGVPWTLRVLRAEVDGLRLADAGSEPDGSRFAGAPRALADLARQLESDPAVAWAEPDWPRAPARVVDDSLPPEPLLRDTRQWGLWNAGPGTAYGGSVGADIHALEAWRTLRRLETATRGGTGPPGGIVGAGPASSGSPRVPLGRPSSGAPPAAVLLAVADTGIDPGHPEFADARTGLPRIAGARSIAEPGASIHDSLGHGTMVAAVMAAATGEGAHFDSLGMAGVCGDCSIMPLRITRGAAGIASSFDIAQAILAATEGGARALNLSFAGGGRSRLERLALTHAITHGTLLVAASGNRGYTEPARLMYPATYAADGLCLAVGASDMWDRRAAFSSYGPHVDLVAPGLDIWSAWMTYPAATGATYPGYVAGSGTSFAAPFAAGTAGLLSMARPDLMADDLRQVLRASADDVGPPGPDAETGSGRLNAAAALAAASPDVAIWHDEVAAGEWRDDDAGTLALGEDGPGAFAARWSGARATRVVCTARIALPDSFADGAHVWLRIAGTTTLRGDFTQPWHAAWCEARIEGRSVVFTGYAFRLDPDEVAGQASEDDRWIPLPPDQMRFGFTVMGTRSRPALATGPPARLRVTPNPASGAVRITVPESGAVAVFDVRGRRVWRSTRIAAGEALWPGTDATGHPAAPGVYLIRFDGPGGTRTARLVRLG